MLILHTSDIHLKNFNDERWKALLSILEIGKQESIDILTICGDLFDKDADAEFLRQDLRSIFSDNGFDIIIVPGNHDCKSYGTNESRLYFGSDVSVIYDLYKPIEYDDIRIWGFPFENIEETAFLSKLENIKDKITQDKTNLLMYHGELLDAFFSRNEFGDEGKERYMPCKLSYFKDLNFNYILAGHFHSRFDVWQPKNDCYFVYPGSPVSLTKREKGVRKVNIFEVGEPPREFSLDTPYYEEIIIEFDPFNENDIIEGLKSRVNKVNLNARIILTVKGYINSKKQSKSEIDLINEIKEIFQGRTVEYNFLIEDINEVLNDELFLKFNKELEREELNEERKQEMRNIVIQAMRRLKS